MKIVALLVRGMFLTSVVADDGDDAKAAELDLMEAENEGDMDRIFGHIAPGRSVFCPTGDCSFWEELQRTRDAARPRVNGASS